MVCLVQALVRESLVRRVGRGSMAPAEIVSKLPRKCPIQLICDGLGLTVENLDQGYPSTFAEADKRTRTNFSAFAQVLCRRPSSPVIPRKSNRIPVAQNVC